MLFVCQGCGEKKRGPRKHGPGWCDCGLDLWVPAESPRKVGKLEPLTGISEEVERIPVGLEKPDALLGGGFPLGACLIFKGGPGAGKSRLALRWASHAGECLFVSLEMSRSVLAFTARDCGARLSRVAIAWDAETALGQLARSNTRHRLCVVDSAQELESEEQLSRFSRWARRRPGCLVLVSQLNQKDQASGRRTLEHNADAVFSFEPGNDGFSRVVPGKNRLGFGRPALFFLGSGE